MPAYIAFLRGINVGGHKPISMDSLKRAFESLGFRGVKTVLASGNVRFETAEKKPESLAEKIRGKLSAAFGYEIGVQLRSLEDLQILMAAEPFKAIKPTPRTRLYVTFLAQKPNSELKKPYRSPEGNYRFVRVTDSEVCSVVVLSPEWGTTELMAVIEKKFGRQVTTRNWNTIEKIIK
jgi:uncharacterized protein (DUF1697 family)